MTMLTRKIQCLVFTRLLVLCMVFALMGCGSATGSMGISATGTASVSGTSTTTILNTESTISFTLSGGNTGSYTVHAAVPTSKLRHGHREFTIDVEQNGMAVFLVFYGYQGPATYTLAQNINGGDIHIALGKNTESWDLSLHPQAQCTMTVQSDIPTHSMGLDMMSGSFSCPLLFSSAPEHPVKPVSVSSGTFTIAIIVES